MDSSNGLGKLLPKSIVAKHRRRKRNQNTEGPQDDDDDDQNQNHSQNHNHNHNRRRSVTSQHFDSDGVSSLHTGEDDESKSYGSYDSDLEHSISRPSTISAHPSQIGYLTTSSPIVQATHLSESITDLDSNISTRSSTFPPQRTDSVDSKESSRLGRSKTGLLPPRNQSQRSPSPGGKLKGIFKPKKSSLKDTSPERHTSTDLPPPLSSNEQTTPNADPEPPLHAPVIEPPAAAKVAHSDRRSRIQPRVDTQLPPRTPPSGDKPAPVIVNTPPTPVDVAYASGQSSPEKKTFWGGSSSSSTANGTSPSRNMSSHRRSRSGSVNIGPSRLSNIVSAPLTPTLESGEPTPNANQNTGFFSSVISVAQNAANTLSNNIQGTSIGIGATKGKSPSLKTQEEPPILSSEVEVKVEAAPEAQLGGTMDQKESAIRTLGSGDLSLSQLGLAEPPSGLATPASARFPDVSDTRARSESAPADAATNSAELVPDGLQSRPRSLYEPPSAGPSTPPPEYVDNKAAGMQRTSSLRSAMKQAHRKRGSSVTTATTVGTAIAAATSSLAHPNLSAPKLTGFAIASKKRNRDFHDLFKSVPDDDYLIEDYSCALQREILAHGRLYVSEGHLCFSSNIFGWTTTLVMSFDEIVSVEKRSTALLFKNGLMISTLHAKHIFASFTSRDATYDLIVNIWKLGHPTLKSTLNGVCLEGTGGDKTEKIDAPSTIDDEAEEGSDSDDESDEDDDFYDEDIHEEIHASIVEANIAETEAGQVASRKASGAVALNTTSPEDGTGPPGAGVDFPGPATHAPTDCGDSASHYDRIVGDDVIAAPLGKVYSLIFGQASPKFMSSWLTGEQKCTELQMEDTVGLSLENRTRSFTFIKPLYAPIGPKQTKCIVTETLENLDYEKAINLMLSTQTPDVPSGNVFSVKTKYCLSWAENNATRVQINCTVEWTGKSWLKSPIEKGANDGQMQYAKDLFAAIKAAVTTRPATGPVINVTAKVRRKGKGKKAVQTAPGTVEGNVAPKRVDNKNWGLFEPVRGLVEPIADIVQPILTGNVMYGLLVGLLVTTWFRVGVMPQKNTPSFGNEMAAYRPDRVAAYDEMWRREDSELWEWLEDRVGLDRLNTDRPTIRPKPIQLRTVEEKVRAARMDEREVEEAIRVTEEKLRILKGAMGKKSKGGRDTDDTA